MQSEESSETLNVEAYCVVSLGEPIPYKIECLATCDDLLFVGTSDSKIAVYRSHLHKASASGASTSTHHTSSFITLLQEVVDPRRQPVRALTVVGDLHLLALVGDTIVLYTFNNNGNNEAGHPLSLSEVTGITGLKDTLSFHVKQQRGTLSLAALQRRRLTIYEATFTHLEFFLKETVSLPDGVRTFGWLGRSFVLGGRKEYFLYHPASSSSIALYPTPRSGATPLVLPMAPVPEVLLAGDGGGVRALLSDGSEVPGDSRVPWTAVPPVAMQYEHPFVISQHATGPHTLQVRLPFLTTLDESVKNVNKHSLLQYLDIPKVMRMSQCWWTDYDCPMPTKTTKANTLARHPIVVSDTSNRLHFLVRTSVAEQAKSLAERQLFAAADLLCQLCPHEVQTDTLHRVVVAGAMHRFLTLSDYAGCFHELSKIDADPRLAIQLFPGFVPSEVLNAWSPPSLLQCPPLPVAPPAVVVTAALPAFVEYLQSRRAALLLYDKSLTATEAVRALLACLDRALVVAWCTMNAEGPLLALLQGENWCVANDVAAVLRSQGQWVALTMLWEAHGAFEAAANQLRRLVFSGVEEERDEEDRTHGGIQTAVPTAVLDALQRFFATHSALPTSDESYVPQTAVKKWAETNALQCAAVINALVGATTALTFFRRRALPQQRQLFSEHLSWVLGCVPADNGLRIFFSSQNIRQYAVALQLLQNYTQMPGHTSKQLLTVSFLQVLFADSRVHVTEEALYEQYWKGLGDLLFSATPSSAAVAERGTAAHLRCRSSLDDFLLTSTHVNLDAAQQYFNADAIKSKCIHERALIYRRQGAHRSAVEMFLCEGDDMEGAKAYANSVRSEDNGDAFTVLLEFLLRPAQGPPREDEALSIMNTCDGVDAALVLPMLPDDLSFTRLSGFLLHAFRDAATAYRMSVVENSVFRAKLLSAEERQVRELSRFAVLEDAMVCPVCQRKLRPDTVMAVYPNGLMVHQVCVSDNHVCPATHRDFRYDAYSLLENL